MRRAAHRWGRGIALAAALLPAARAQTVPVAPVPVVRPAPATPEPPATETAPATAVPPSTRVRSDSLRPVPAGTPTFVADTVRRVVVVNATEPTTEVTRRTGLRIGAVIFIITLTTLLLYNVRSR